MAGNPNWKKGKSGNPGGRPKVLADVRALAREHTATALETLVEIASNKKAAPAARVSASTAILDRGYGKPAQALTGEDGAPIKTFNEIVMRIVDSQD